MELVTIQNNPENMSEEPKKEENTTPKEEGSTSENKDQNQLENTNQKNEGAEKIEVETNELETLRKKAADFDNMVANKRIEKLNSKKETAPEGEKTNESMNEVMQEIKKVNERLDARDLADRQTNLKGAYQDFISNNGWANNDEVFAKINENFDSEGAFTKEQYAKKIEEAALKAAPEKYKEYLKNNAEKEVLSKKFNLDNGGNAGGGSPAKDQISENNMTEEEKKFKEIQDRLSKNLPPGFKA